MTWEPDLDPDHGADLSPHRGTLPNSHAAHAAAHQLEGDVHDGDMSDHVPSHGHHGHVHGEGQAQGPKSTRSVRNMQSMQQSSHGSPAPWWDDSGGGGLGPGPGPRYQRMPSDRQIVRPLQVRKVDLRCRLEGGCRYGLGAVITCCPFLVHTTAFEC